MKGSVNTITALEKLEMIKSPQAQRDNKMVHNSNKTNILISEQINLQKEEIKQLKNNYEKLNELYQLKVEEAKQYIEELETSKKDNKKMFGITVASGIVGLLSLISTILIAIFK